MCWFTITLKLEILVDLYLEDLISKSVFKNDVFAKINLKIWVSHNHVYNGIALPNPTLNLVLNLKNNLKLYFSLSLSISSSHCCLALVLFRFRVLGHLACGLCNFGWGDAFSCCWVLSSSLPSFWLLQNGQSGPHLHFSEDCSFILGSLGLSYVIRKDFLWSKAWNSKWAQNWQI